MAIRHVVEGGHGHGPWGGAEPHRAGVDDGLLERKTFSQPQLDEVHRMIELRPTMPAPAMKPIIDVAVKSALGGSVMTDDTQSPECLTGPPKRTARRRVESPS